MGMSGDIRKLREMRFIRRALRLYRLLPRRFDERIPIPKNMGFCDVAIRGAKQIAVVTV